jgi:hypothetical protein
VMMLSKGVEDLLGDGIEKKGGCLCDDMLVKWHVYDKNIFFLSLVERKHRPLVEAIHSLNLCYMDNIESCP